MTSGGLTESPGGTGVSGLFVKRAPASWLPPALRGPHGAHAISRRSWRSGEKAIIAPLVGEFPQVGRVVYCETRTGGRFCLGVEFPDRSVKWADYART
jgi:hypothetical protein